MSVGNGFGENLQIQFGGSRQIIEEEAARSFLHCEEIVPRVRGGNAANEAGLQTTVLQGLYRDALSVLHQEERVASGKCGVIARGAAANLNENSAD